MKSSEKKAKAKKKVEMSDEVLEMIADRFRLLSDPMRLRILHTLGDEEMSVTELVKATGAGQANISKHLSVLLNAGVVSRRKEGLNSFYRVSDETIFELCDAVCSHLVKQLEMRRSVLEKLKPLK
ncbi:MAG: ArsR family transcriptional regulator [Acidobacteria bacterium]|jgi:ArsR family transcriptional regulator|nr:MAG: ArsR family transcriptional regulator [Acidobacteriota bacterium]GIU80972.1 MAG: transcriptional regulator [Pyrinomonadaceae bacterium]